MKAALQPKLHAPHLPRLAWKIPAVPSVALVTVLLMVLAALLGPALHPTDPNTGSLLTRLQPPVFAGGSWTYPLGTDEQGRDILARLLWGARTSFLVSGSATLLGLLVGVTLGMAAGYARGSLLDHLINFLAELQLGLPFVLLAITASLVFGKSLAVLVVLAALSTWPTYARVTYGSVLSLRQREFVTAAEALGASEVHVALRHLLPHLAAPLAIFGTLCLGAIILLESSLSFLGIGIQTPLVSWGAMIGEGREYLSSAWWLALTPGLALSVLILCIGLIGDWLRDHFDPRTTGGRS
ncbi:peptide/nickel transport system permease protein [Deinobacterium chartae]|uniref:Peptide/nickel transport system permease protein n=1 Tax=Deinobacterium chartae TaxID=521158 RepID=A0A841I8I5_9DEIO|nr:ABC transporter permease [Deinobacterium chartae]MBB6100132.1 peptide/nickel transport system permease protein [Deinobacterium chartae]